jgi:hypothetical protein
MSGPPADGSDSYAWLRSAVWNIKNKQGLDPLSVEMPKGKVAELADGNGPPEYVRLLIGNARTGPVLRWILSESADETVDVTVVKKIANAGTTGVRLQPVTERQFQIWWALHGLNQRLSLVSLMMTLLAALFGGSLLIGKYWHPITLSSGLLAVTQTLAVVLAVIGSALTLVKTCLNPAP